MASSIDKIMGNNLYMEQLVSISEYSGVSDFVRDFYVLWCFKSTAHPFLLFSAIAIVHFSPGVLIYVVWCGMYKCSMG